MIGIFGGSFDPIHNGHLRAALEVLQRLELKKILFVPCQQHAFGKTFNATAAQRLEMLELAIQGEEEFVVDARELQRTGISYTIDTLIELNAENPNEIYSLILGMDTFLSLHKWHQEEEILNYANVIVVDRPALEATRMIDSTFADYVCTNVHEFMHSKAGKIFFLSAPLLEISATYIRNEVAANKSIRYLVPEAVADYIQTEKIYSS
ncbi:MAG: nicotinate-nucleotide adenylyltransferase [Gammaproteobacteria bacterium]|nr:nicotinate-nucleotide adenylyltransferase [Gammaproteobacteria bacterium]